MQTKFEQVLGQAIVHPLDSELCRVKECNLGNLITDAAVQYRAVQYRAVNKHSPGIGGTDAAVSVYNGGSISSYIDIGNITLQDLLEATPYSNRLVILNMTGV